jgi:predicted transcriptional regulator
MWIFAAAAFVKQGRNRKTMVAKSKLIYTFRTICKRSKTAEVVAMLQRKAGSTITEIMAAMHWQRHTVRGFMAGAMKKAGYTIESFKPENGERTYRIGK